MRLPNEQLAAIADLTAALTLARAPVLFSDDKAMIDATHGRLAAGRGVAWDDVKARLDARLVGA